MGNNICNFNNSFNSIDIGSVLTEALTTDIEI